MKLVNRVFLSVFGLIIFSTLASTILGAMLISDAVRSEAKSRVELGLKEARSEIDAGLAVLSLYAQVFAAGTLVTLPVLIFALLVQRNLVRGLTMGAFK